MFKLHVQMTNDASSISKCSAAFKNYFQDNYIKHFVGKIKHRTSLINLGYHTRVVVLFELIKSYINFLVREEECKLQIISCGSGFDTTYWKLVEHNLLSQQSVFVEIDFPNIIERKINLIMKADNLKSYTSGCWQKSNFIKSINQLNHNHFLLQADLSDIKTLEEFFDRINIDYNKPTLFLSECVITYMEEESSKLLLEWMAKRFTCSTFINYEQIHPTDGFGQIMLNHFKKLQCTLHSVNHYPNCASHCSRYKENGFETSVAVSEWDAFMLFTSQSERQRVLMLELFDEFEEFHAKCIHYVIGIAGNGIGSKWIHSLPIFNGPLPETRLKNTLLVQHLSNDLALYRHCSSLSKKKLYIFGGYNKKSRSSDIFRMDLENKLNIEHMEILGTHEVQLDVICAAVTCFELNGNEFCCLFGGRTSPDSPCNGGAVALFQILDNKLTIKLVIRDDNPTPRYRAPVVSLKAGRSKVQCWRFGGRTNSLRNPSSDLSVLDLFQCDRQTIQYTWRTYKKLQKEWPSARMSHSMAACSKTYCFFLSCGINAESLVVFNDIWKWSSKEETWAKLDLVGHLLPRYGHTSHLLDDNLYLVGGMNTLAGQQPGLAKIGLKTLTVTEFSLQAICPHPVLFFNHTSEVDANNEGCCRILIVGGGGNCFSFGTQVNEGIHIISIDKF